MLFIIDLQYITIRKVKSGCALNPKLRPQSRESEPIFRESVALSPNTRFSASAIFAYGHLYCSRPGIPRHFSGTFANKFASAIYTAHAPAFPGTSPAPLQINLHCSRLLRYLACGHLYCCASAIANKFALLSASAYICCRKLKYLSGQGGIPYRR